MRKSVPTGLLLLLVPGVAHAHGMGAVGMANAILAGASATASAFYLVCAIVAWFVLRTMRGKPRHVVRLVFGILSLVLAVPGALLMLGVLLSTATTALEPLNSTLGMLPFVLPPFVCALLLGVFGVRLLRENRTAPPAKQEAFQPSL